MKSESVELAVTPAMCASDGVSQVGAQPRGRCDGHATHLVAGVGGKPRVCLCFVCSVKKLGRMLVVFAVWAGNF